MRTTELLALLLLAASACKKDNHFVATEMIGDADLRVDLAIASTGQTKIEAHTPDEPFTFMLKDPFDHGATVHAYVFAFSASALGEAYPPLAGRNAADLKTMLNPAMGAPGPGGYAYPKPLHILRAQFDSNSGSDVAYEEVRFEDLADYPDAAFVLGLAAEIACAPGVNAFRAFNRSDPARVCLFQRNSGCGWDAVGGACMNLDTVFDRTFDPGVMIGETPPDGLAASPGMLHCGDTPSTELGETRSWVCPGTAGSTFVSIQDTPRALGSNPPAPWVPKLEQPVAGGSGGAFARTARGAIHATVVGTSVILRYLQGDATVSPDTLHQASGSSSFPIELPAQSTTQVAIGNLQRVSANAIDSNDDQVVIDGDRGTYALIGDHSVSTSGVALSFYHRPIPLPEAVLPVARRVGHVITGPGSAIYALVDRGIAVLRADLAGQTITRSTETNDPRISFSRATSPQIAAVSKGNQERVVVWQNDGHVFVFDGSGIPLITDCQLDGEIYTAIDGPRLVRRAPGDRFAIELVDLAPAETGGPGACASAAAVKRYLVPPNNADASGHLFVEQSSFARLADHETLAYRYGSYVGVLDLGSGSSQAIAFPIDAPATVLFESFSRTELWIAAAQPDGTLYQVARVPKIED